MILLQPTQTVPASLFAEAEEQWSIHREAPEFTEQSTEQEILVTGIKVGAGHRSDSHQTQ